MTVIAFIALTLATPKITMLKKAYIIFVGIVVFVLTDFIFIQYFKGESSLREDSDVFKVYLCIKLLLPFLLWILPNYSHLGGFLAASNKNSKELSDNQFPAK